MSDDYARRTGQRLPSEETQFEQARREMARTPPVTVMEDFVGGFSPAKASGNALRDAIRNGLIDKIKASGYSGQESREKYGFYR